MKKILNALVCALLVVSMFFGAASTANAAVKNVNDEMEDVCYHEWLLAWEHPKVCVNLQTDVR